MIGYIKHFIKHPLILSSTIVFASSFIASFFQYLFNLFMGRLLPVQEYGLLISLMSLVTIFAVFQGSISSIISKFVAQYHARSDKKAYHLLIEKGILFISLASVGILILLSIFIVPFSSFLHIQQKILLVLTFVTISSVILFSFPIGVTQGNMKFILLSILNILSPVLKIILGIGALLLGLGIQGVLGGVILSFLIPTAVGTVIIFREYDKRIASKADKSLLMQEVKKYSYGFFLASLGIALVINGDVILVRHLFSPENAGLYAALSLMGKAIFYLSAPLYYVFFPLIAHQREKKEKVSQTLLFGGVIIGCFSFGMSAIYFLFPGIILKVFFPAAAYQVLKPLLGPFSIYIVFFSFVYLLNSYFLSIGKTGIYKINLAFVLLYVSGFFMFHQSLMQVVMVLIALSFLQLISYFVYYSINGRH